MSASDIRANLEDTSDIVREWLPEHGQQVDKSTQPQGWVRRLSNLHTRLTGTHQALHRFLLSNNWPLAVINARTTFGSKRAPLRDGLCSCWTNLNMPASANQSVRQLLHLCEVLTLAMQDFCQYTMREVRILMMLVLLWMSILVAMMW